MQSKIYYRFYALCTCMLTFMALSAQATISGSVESVYGEFMTNANIQVEALDDGLTIPDFDVVFDADNQTYTLTFNGTVPDEGAFRLSVQRIEEVPNGVSTLDVVLTMRHILLVDAFDQAAAVLAADVNQDDEVTATDLVLSIRTILGIDPAAPWSFYTTNPINLDELTDDNYPSRSYDLNFNQLPATDKAFYGLKVGDVNGTATVD